MSELLNRLKKATVVKESSDLASSTVINSLDTIPTPIPALNIAFSGRVDGGFTSGLTIFCGASATFKSAFALLCAKSYMDKYDDAVLIFYDSEMGASKAYFESMGIDLERVLHIPITDVEEFRFDIAKKTRRHPTGRPCYDCG